MINVSQSFHRTSANAVDDTLTLTKAQMLAVNDNLMPAKYLTICQDDGFIYLYDKSATPNSTTGKFKKFEGGSGVTDYPALTNKPQIGGVTLVGNKTASDLGLATDDEYSGSTAGLVPAAGSDNEGKYLDNDGNWTVVPMPMIGTINRSDIYDTTEKVIGKWTDNRPLYQKTIDVTVPTSPTNGTLSSSDTSWSSLGISNISKVVYVVGYIFNSTNNIYRPINVVQTDSTNYNIPKGINVVFNIANGVTLNNTIAAFSGMTATLTIRYTKTTDAANSYNYADENDYSTSEKIIGKWIDGKTLYQRVYTGTTPAITAGTLSNTVIISETSSYNIVSLEGWCPCTTGFAGLPMNHYNTSTKYSAELFTNSTSQIKFRCNDAEYSQRTYYIIVKYTKS